MVISFGHPNAMDVNGQGLDPNGVPQPVGMSLPPSLPNPETENENRLNFLILAEFYPTSCWDDVPPFMRRISWIGWELGSATSFLRPAE